MAVVLVPLRNTLPRVLALMLVAVVVMRPAPAAPMLPRSEARVKFVAVITPAPERMMLPELEVVNATLVEFKLPTDKLPPAETFTLAAAAPV